LCTRWQSSCTITYSTQGRGACTNREFKVICPPGDKLPHRLRISRTTMRGLSCPSRWNVSKHPSAQHRTPHGLDQNTSVAGAPLPLRGKFSRADDPHFATGQFHMILTGVRVVCLDAQAVLSSKVAMRFTAEILPGRGVSFIPRERCQLTTDHPARKRSFSSMVASSHPLGQAREHALRGAPRCPVFVSTGARQSHSG